MTTKEDKRKKYNIYMREHIECPGCHKMIPRGYKSVHMKSLVHQKNTQDPEELMKYRTKLERQYDLKIETLEKTKKRCMNDIIEQIRIVS